MTSKKRRQPTGPKRRAPAASQARRGVAAASRDDVRQLRRERDEALEQQAATADVLKTISRSTFDLRQVLETLTESAARLCEADMASIVRPEGNHFIFSSNYRFPQAFVDLVTATPLRTGRGSLAERVLAEGGAVHIPDAVADPSYKFSEGQKAAAFRSMLGVPLLRGGTAIGVIILTRLQVRPFTDRQIELVTTFADQAVIAIENARLFEAEQQRTRELSESLEQQTATSEVLKVISQSPGALEPVFDVVLESATQLCEAYFGMLYRYEDGAFRAVALRGAPPAFVEFQQRGPIRPTPASGLGRVMSTRLPVHIVDTMAEQRYIDGDPYAVTAVRLSGSRTLIFVPMLRDDELVGAITIYRREVRPFTDKQIELLQNFAAQAVIAIENTRLLSELRESLEQQTATSEVLKTISSSPGELTPVFDAMLDNASRLCEAQMGELWLLEDAEAPRIVATQGSPPEWTEFRRQHPQVRPGPMTLVGRVRRTKQTIHVIDVKADASAADDPFRAAFSRIVGARTLLAVPMLKDDALVGIIVIYRMQQGAFGAKQIELVENFAAQAVIAIENARLLSELRQRTDDLSEALEQQTATSEVLNVISRSPTDTQPVFDAIVESAARLCDAVFSMVWLFDGELQHYAAGHNVTSEALEHVAKAYPRPPDRLTTAGRAILAGEIVHVPDIANDREYAQELAAAGRWCAAVAVPMLRDGKPIGAISIGKAVAGPFLDRQVQLLTIFADQAVIAIENTRLLSELRESLQQQTATADVLKVISRSAFDLKVVLDTLLRSAGRLCDADMGVIARRQDDRFYRTASYGMPDEFSKLIDDQPVELGRDSGSGRALLEGRIIQIPDIETDTEYTYPVRGTGTFRTLLGVPMLREGVPVGVMTLMRKTVQPFTDKQIELVSTFADQAAIAIENVRLFDAEQERTRELTQSLEDLRAAQDRLVQTEKLASLGQLTAGIAHEIKNPLNFVNNFSGVSVELIDELQETLAGIGVDDKTRADIDELSDTLRDNMRKVVQHGKRADSIVKNMLMHSRQGSGERRPTDVNALVEESLNLAYHGARAEKQGFDITLQRSFDPAAGEIEVFPQEITRVLLNLIGNGFYAASKRQAGNGENFAPTLAAATRNLGDRVEISIRDNGTGIPPEVKEKMFNPFFTTKPAGEGTGLGLSLSHDIVVKQHSGSIEVETEPGAFTEFRIVLPRTSGKPSQ
jgi:GAF domain-containing protein